MKDKDGNHTANGKVNGKPYDPEFISPPGFMERLFGGVPTMQRCPHCGNMHLTVKKSITADDL